MAHHHYKATITWTGNRGSGTESYKAYDRSHRISIEGKSLIEGSSDPVFRGDKTKHTPEDLMVCALSGCHMLSYLHLCAVNGVIVTEYVDHASGVMEETPDGGGQFIGATLNPLVTVKERSMIEKANALHHDASKKCFIAQSVNFAVHHKPKAIVAELHKA